MPDDDFAEGGPEAEPPIPDEAEDPSEDSITDWPADAIPPEPIEPDWTPGQVLGYAKRREPRLPGQRRRSSVSRVVGTIAMWMGISAATALVGAVLVNVLVNFRAARTIGVRNAIRIAYLVSLLAWLMTLAAIVLGTIGRLNHDGRRAATLGRRVGCGIPLAFLLLALVLAITRGDVIDVLRVGAILVFTLLVGSLIILIFDAILGAD